MNWLDGVILVLMVLGGVIGWRMGLVRSIFLVVGLILGAILAAQISDRAAGWFTDTPDAKATASVIAYGIILLAVFIAAQVLGSVAARVLRPPVLKAADGAGGVAFGIATGLLLGGALVTGMARFAFQVSESRLERIERAAADTTLRDRLKGALVDSALVPGYLDGRKKLPGSALGMVPGDYKAALDDLERARE
jgi:uncharacterized membrane protein required for colicin V production